MERREISELTLIWFLFRRGGGEEGCDLGWRRIAVHRLSFCSIVVDLIQ